MFTTQRIGIWSEPARFTVAAERTIAYAEATNDPLAPHLDGTQAPPVFAVVPGFDVMAGQTLAAAPEDAAGRILHGRHDLYISRPIVPGDVLSTRAQVVGVHGRSSGVVVTTLVETEDAAGEPVNEQYFTGFFRGVRHEGDAGRTTPEVPAAGTGGEPLADVVQKIDRDQTHRYADASGDRMPVHLDDDFARGAGLPGIIVHGLCTMAFASHALITRTTGEPSRLRRLAVRFSAPARPGQEITTTVRHAGPNAFSFDTVDDRGVQVLSSGRAEFAD
ncbi:MaoC/PaaZ C-terminal domain-containing protein [Streptomyces sp. NPDC057245]|uniref:MaoC/PaaZ C-terminal domain-containing protein n=1 Tax=Streptomyces TaxID=1883 RepID=UPI001C1E0B27|nr:MaoC/PaaZ C-terminal domain-containing protein [Streptomyces sp. A108]MBU6530429.1 MaoC family dehydratase N-terminal domain-containing protein [Streptomyces sp. A108]